MLVMDLEAIVLADDPLARVKIAGLSVRERAVRVAKRVGATRVTVVDTSREVLAAHGRATAVLVIRADQLVHTPLVAPLVEAKPRDGIAIATGPEGDYAGALLAVGAFADDVIARLARGEADAAIAAGATTRVPHGPVARHPIATPADRRAASKLLYSILIKPQDNALTRYLYRPVSLPLTKLLVHTPITPNQVSLAVAVVVAIGCWLTARASMTSAIIGTALIVASQYLDCCDGEIARLKLMSSRFGAWLDTVVDELSSIAYIVAIGYHCHLVFGPGYFGAVGGELGVDPWLAMIAISVVALGWSMYCIYYNIIVGVGSANSQDYAGKFDVVPGTQPNSVRLRPATSTAIATTDLPPWLAWLATYAPYVVRRDFITWLTLFLAIAHLTQVSFLLLVVGGLVMTVIVTLDHVRLRRLRRSIRARGQILEPAR